MYPQDECASFFFFFFFKRQATIFQIFIISRVRCSDKLLWGMLKFLKYIYLLSKNVYVYYICIIFLNIHKRIHSVSDQQVNKFVPYQYWLIIKQNSGILKSFEVFRLFINDFAVVWRYSSLKFYACNCLDVIFITVAI